MHRLEQKFLWAPDSKCRRYWWLHRNDKTTQKNRDYHKQGEHQVSINLSISICNINVIVTICVHIFNTLFLQQIFQRTGELKAGMTQSFSTTFKKYSKGWLVDWLIDWLIGWLYVGTKCLYLFWIINVQNFVLVFTEESCNSVVCSNYMFWSDFSSWLNC